MVVFLRGDKWVRKNESGVKGEKKFVTSQFMTDAHTVNFRGCNSCSEKH